MSKITLSSEDGLRCEPIQLMAGTERDGEGVEMWAYEIPNGISVYFYSQKTGGVNTIIPLRSIRAYMRHLQKGASR
jgi:hypothetical protein